MPFDVRVEDSSGRVARRVEKNKNRAYRLMSSPIVEQIRSYTVAYECCRQKVAVFQCEVNVNHLRASAEWRNEALERADLLRSELESICNRREAVLPLALVFQNCELTPLRAKLDGTLDLLNGLRQRVNYLKLWITNQVTAPALEVLLYMCLPISSAESLAGDLEEEYVCAQVPQQGPQAAKWWYTKQVLATLYHYFARVVKHASLFASAMELLLRSWAWIIRLHSR